jgi:predicted AAA+ superfamily ATPase
MKKRTLTGSIQELSSGGSKMALVSGPRQCGKTTLAKMLLRERKSGAYFNWDDPVFRRAWVKGPGSLVPAAEARRTPLLVLDEIHKDRRWKRTLKGIYDTLERPCDIVVTGSARLDVYKKGSDSLLGRYFPFRLHPFSLRELHDAAEVAPEGLIESIFSRSKRRRKGADESLKALMKFGPFPEPLLGQNTRKARLWRRTRREIVVREDLRDISRIPELSRIELMISLLPERVGSLFSLNSVREDMEVSHETVKRWITYLKALYYLFEVKPYHRSIPRALKKEGKIYFWDFGEVEDEAARFENLVANHLLKACHYWTDTGYGSYELFFLRNREKQEIDFLVLKDGQPWLPVEVKLTETSPSPNWRKFLPLVSCQRGIQVVTGKHWKIHSADGQEVLVAGAAELLDYLP